MKDAQLLILGGGASGLAAAIEAARQGADVTVLEKLDRVGKKILATGNGRCNLLNIHASPADYNDPPFVGRVFAQFGVQSDADFFRSLGLLTAADSEGRVYPRSNAASSVLDVLRLECARLGVRFICGEAATSIRRGNGAFVVNGSLRAHAVIVACGGKASPAHGTDGSGYRLMQAFGHACTDLRPALVQLRTDPDFVKGLKGLRAAVTLTLQTPQGDAFASQGEVLFADYGLSGIAAMELARYAADGGTLYIDFLPDLDARQTLEYLQNARERTGGAARGAAPEADRTVRNADGHGASDAREGAQGVPRSGARDEGLCRRAGHGRRSGRSGVYRRARIEARAGAVRLRRNTEYRRKMRRLQPDVRLVVRPAGRQERRAISESIKGKP